MGPIDQVFAAAEELFSACDRAKFPTVYEVRKRARVSMAMANEGMQQWRRRKLVSISRPTEIAIPQTVIEASNAALAQLWAASADIAQKSLIAAQQGFDEQEAAVNANNLELTMAFDLQFAEFEALRSEYENHRACSTADLAAAAEQARGIRAQFEELKTRADTANARAEEIEKRANDLTIARDLAQASSLQVAADYQVRLDEVKRSETEARAREYSAREEAAQFRGQLESLKLQHAELVGTLSLGSKRRQTKTI
jgi:colicin import membrane protein